jgi:ADP-ribose pyrophosphatase YjhB (NUDIX family)
MFGRHTRYQGAIVRDHHILLVKELERATGRLAWFVPGGGMEPGETAEQCVRRELKEETNLDVKVIRLLLDGPKDHTGSPYKRHLTYLCEPVARAPEPGDSFEDKEEGHFSIVGVGWFDLRRESDWDPLALSDAITHGFLQLVRS